MSAGYPPTLVCDARRGPVGGDGRVAHPATIGDDVRPVLLACSDPCFDRASRGPWSGESDGERPVWGMNVAEYLAAPMVGMATRPAAANEAEVAG